MTHIIPMWLTTIIIAISVFSFVATQIYLYFNLIFLIFIGLTTKGKVITKGNEAYR